MKNLAEKTLSDQSDVFVKHCRIVMAVYRIDNAESVRELLAVCETIADDQVVILNRRPRNDN